MSIEAKRITAVWSLTNNTKSMRIEIMSIKDKTAVWSLTNGNKTNRIVRETVKEKIDDFDAVGRRPDGGNFILSTWS